LLSFTLIAK